ncbi:MAG: 30S ribosomal protein S4 [Candidatus Nealsonbacteria bacterium]|nr:30S ribosomal protein S4 [Candidatus Nealsonbacteria bacterium]
MSKKTTSNGAKCKICRRLNAKLFLKGTKCLLPKCLMNKKPYPPGQKRKRRAKTLSEYGRGLKEKQKLKNWYNLKEKQFRNYVEKVLNRKGKVENADAMLIKILESRLDNVVFRMGFASSRPLARQIISHRHISVNDRLINISSYLVKKEDRISLKLRSSQNLTSALKKHKTPSWLKLDIKKMAGKVIGEPDLAEALPPVEISLIFEHYSR